MKAYKHYLVYEILRHFTSCFRYHERGETTTLTVEKEGLFDVSVNKMLDVEQLQPETVFQCLLRIPGTQFSVREETMYFPGKGNLTNE